MRTKIFEMVCIGLGTLCLSNPTWAEQSAHDPDKGGCLDATLFTTAIEKSKQVDKKYDAALNEAEEASKKAFNEGYECPGDRPPCPEITEYNVKISAPKVIRCQKFCEKGFAFYQLINSFSTQSGRTYFKNNFVDRYPPYNAELKKTCACEGSGSTVLEQGSEHEEDNLVEKLELSRAPALRACERHKEK